MVCSILFSYFLIEIYCIRRFIILYVVEVELAGNLQTSQIQYCTDKLAPSRASHAVLRTRGFLEGFRKLEIE